MCEGVCECVEGGGVMVAFETWRRSFEFSGATDAEDEHQQAAERHDVCELPRAHANANAGAV